MAHHRTPGRAVVRVRDPGSSLLPRRADGTAPDVSLGVVPPGIRARAIQHKELSAMASLRDAVTREELISMDREQLRQVDVGPMGRYYPATAVVAPTPPPPPAPPRKKSQGERARELLTRIAADSRTNVGIEAMREREGEFGSRMAAVLAGIYLYPESRRVFNDNLDELWAEAREDGIGKGVGGAAPREIIIGAGLHAAIYASVRVSLGFPRPLVLEARDVAGGVMHSSRNPAFYLNSRNRPGDLSIPGRSDGALNVLPRGPVQPSDLGGDEYQRNSDLAFAVRAALAMNAQVMTGVRVSDVRIYTGYGSNAWRVELEDGASYYAGRLIGATGIGRARKMLGSYGERVMSFQDFMSRMDETFPLRDVRSVAVIGAGDSGKTVIEALTGQGPSMGWSVAGIDYPERIDWYGFPDDQVTRASWEQCNRSRYKGIGRMLPNTSTGERGRITPVFERAEFVAGGLDVGFVNERPYDLVITCAGYVRQRSPISDQYEMGTHPVDGRLVGRRASGTKELYEIGTCANLDVGDLEQRSSSAFRVDENTTSLFRYAGRTASLAASLDR